MTVGRGGSRRSSRPLGLLRRRLDGRVFALDEETTVLGRDDRLATILIEDDQASKVHAYIEWQTHHYELRDAKSTNGTFLNNKRLGRTAVALKEGDRILIGKTELLFSIEAMELNETPAPAPPVFEQSASVAALRLPPPPEANAVFAGSFRIVRELGEGGLGKVYEAEHLATGRMRALKILKRAFDAKLRARFEQEARVIARIQSEHVVDVLDAGVDGATGFPWLSMELLTGEDLATVLTARTRLSKTESAELFRQLCHGLGAAHAAAIVHRWDPLESTCRHASLSIL